MGDAADRIRLGLGKRAAAAARYAQIRELAGQGYTVAEIAEQVGGLPATVRRQLAGAGRWRDLAERDAAVVTLYRAGHTIADIAERTGVAKTQAGRIVQRAGVSRSRGPVPKAAGGDR